VANGKDLKLIWEGNQNTERIVKILQPLRDLAAEESMSFSFAGRQRNFFVFNIANKSIRAFQERVRALPDSLP